MPLVEIGSVGRGGRITDAATPGGRPVTIDGLTEVAGPPLSNVPRAPKPDPVVPMKKVASGAKPRKKPRKRVTLQAPSNSTNSRASDESE